MHTVYEALLDFKLEPRDGRPTAIICRSTKGHGGFSSFMNSHKVTIPEPLLDQEVALQTRQRDARVDAFLRLHNALAAEENGAVDTDALRDRAQGMGYEVLLKKGEATGLKEISREVTTEKAPVRDKKIAYAPEALPKIEVGKSYAVDKIVDGAMRVFAMDSRVVSIDSDLASTSGLQSGIGFVDKARALNAGVAEANMMLIGEAYAILGYNAWVSTFCPFYDWKVLRRIAVGHQERLEVIAAGGWLSEGHGIDYAMLATAADLETQSNGATHMGNDDALLLNEAAHVQIINVSCPQQLLAVMKWVMEGNRGVLYIRVLRSPAPAVYGPDFTFEFGRAYTVRASTNPAATIITSGRCLFEAIAAVESLAAKGIEVELIDMPSIDEEAILRAYGSGKPVIIAEQNNGYLWSNVRRVLFSSLDSIDTTRLVPINTTGDAAPHYIHSGTYTELATHYGLNASGIETRIEAALS
jgi:transketolase C-terminal domain/subunit